MSPTRARAALGIGVCREEFRRFWTAVHFLRFYCVSPTARGRHSVQNHKSAYDFSEPHAREGGTRHRCRWRGVSQILEGLPFSALLLREPHGTGGKRQRLPLSKAGEPHGAWHRHGATPRASPQDAPGATYRRPECDHSRLRVASPERVVCARAREGGIACYTQEEVGEAVGLDRSEVARATGEVCETEDLPKSTKPSPHARAGAAIESA